MICPGGWRKTPNKNIFRLEVSEAWAEIEMSPKDYGKLTGHSERYVRDSFLKGSKRNDPDAMIRVRIGRSDLIDSIWSVKEG